MSAEETTSMSENDMEVVKNMKWVTAYQQRESTTPTPRHRTNSDLSKNSATSERESAPIAFDSGNYSTSSNASELVCPFEVELHNHCQHMHTLLRERDQALNRAMQDVRKLRSELERLNKSEEWYKKELRSQKSTRLEALERLYAQERKYMQENQRLQRECMRLYDKCGEMEKELQSKQDAAVQKLVENEEQQEARDDGGEIGSTFELEQQRLLIDDQQRLINVLRKQKHALLEDLSQLNEEKDAKVMELQETLAGVEVENTHMTAQCMRLLVERQRLEDTLQLKDAALVAENAENSKMRIIIEQLKQQSDEQQQMLAHKEHEINEIQKQFKDNMKNESNMDEVHRLSISYHDDINAKTAEISLLKKSLQAVKHEMDALADLQAQNNEQGRQIEQLNFNLETQQCELANLQETGEEKTQQITELHRDLERIRTQHDNMIEDLHSTQTNLKSVKQELIVLHEQYASMCALCEKTRFELEMLEIEKNKLRFKADSDKREIELMRGKLKVYLKYTAELGAKINELEEKLNCSKIEKDELQIQLRQLENQLLLKNTENQKMDQQLIRGKESIEQNKAVIDRFHKEHELFSASTEVNVDSIKVDQTAGDSGFLDITKNSYDEYGNNENSQDSSYSFRSQLIDGNETLLEHLSLQNDTLKERRKLNDAFQDVICNKTSSIVENKELCMNNGEKHDFVALLERQDQLMEYLNDQNQLTVERRELLEAFETLINREVGSQETSINNRDILKKKNITKGIKKQISLAMANDQTDVYTLRQKLTEKNIQCIELDEVVKNQSAELQSLEKKLLECDEKHMQTRMEQEKIHKAQLQTYQDAIQRLQADNERLTKEFHNVLEAKSDIESMLEKQNQLISELRAKLVEYESRAHLVGSQSLHSSEKQEILSLKKKVEQLEDRLQAANNGEEDRRTERIRLIRKLLEQQNSKVKQLTESQEEWEELHAALQTAQAMVENMRAELQLKHAELDELNALFAEQNEELTRLQEKAILGDCNANPREVEENDSKFQQQIKEMQIKLSTQLADSEAQQRKIEELQGINERLECRLNEDYAEEVAKNQKQLRTLQAKIEKLQAERNSYAERLAEIENEMQQLKKSKREALMLPPEFMVLPVTAGVSSTAETSSSSCDGNASLDVSAADNNDRMRILTKVLEAEYRRKMKRYDLHIHTLLNNIKKLKKSLRSTEQRAAHLTMEQSRTKEELRSLQLTRRQLEEMRLKCEQNQNTIKALEHALEMERKKFEASDFGKTVYTHDSPGETLQRDEPAHEVANLIDDYKKLIKQSALVTQRPTTSAILDLIQRSNQCVPNLYKLETTVDGLRSDLEHFLSSNIINIRYQQSTNKLEGPSLMEELRSATESC